MDDKAIIYSNNNLINFISGDGHLLKENNVVFPVGLHEFLALISQDPGYHNKETFARALHLDIELVPELYKDFLSYLNSNNDGTLRVLNNTFLKQNYKLREQFKTLLLNNFLCELAAVDWSDCNMAARSVNVWVEDSTEKKIVEFVKSDTLEKETRLALLNITNFSGKWAQEFNVETTTSATFYLNNNDTIEVPMMKMKTEVYYNHNDYDGYQIIELPYTNEDFGLLIILPNKNTSLKDLEERIHMLNINLESMEVDISLPKFNIEKRNEFKSALMKIGLEKELKNGNLFGIIDSDEWLNVGKIHQTGMINVNEAGSEAASATIFSFVPSKADDKPYPPKDGLVIYEIDIKSNISNRFAKILVISKVKNTNKSAKEATFTVVLPETAFITQFVMEIEGKVYTSYIDEKEKAKAIYNEAVTRGKSAGIVEAAARDSNEFNISVNLEPETVAIFSLTYEEMLQRIHDQYELVLNIRPGQIVEQLNVEVNINESRPLKFVRTPAIRSGNEIGKNEEYLKPSADVKINSKSAVIKFSPNTKQQKRLAGYLGTNIADGFSGQFVVQYDVERDPFGEEILLQDGYFVHFFAPNDLDPLPMHVVFVLDTSTSMCGKKISQLKDAMMSILDDIRTNNLISIIEYNSDVVVWDINSEKPMILEFGDDFEQPFNQLRTQSLPSPARVNEDVIKKAKNVVQKMEVGGCTFMIGAIESALFLVKLEQEQGAEKKENYQPIIVFLTDGESNVGICSTEEIIKLVTQLNSRNDKVPIFSLSFGRGADKGVLRELSSKNLGFSRHIYEDSDACLQLQAFYKQISSPLLTDVKFKYDSDVKELTRSCFPLYFRGAEIVVSGKYTDEFLPTSIHCHGPKGSVILNSAIEHPVSSLERLWAYLTVKQLLDDKSFIENNSDLIKRATELALKYSFVTEVTSLVVVKPDGSNPVGAGEAVEETTEGTDYQLKVGQPKKKIVKRRIIKKKMCYEESSPESCENIKNEEEKEPEKKSIPQFIADHPFLVILRLKKGDSKINLFIGRVYNLC